MEHYVLIVDDEPMMLSAMKRILRNDHINILTCKSYAEAVETLTNENISLVITDVMLESKDINHKHNGIALLEFIKETFKDIPVIVMSGNPDALAVAKFKGADERIHKPYYAEEVNIIVNHYLKFLSNITEDRRSSPHDRRHSMGRRASDYRIDTNL